MEKIYKITESDNLCLAGGIALNSITNGMIKKHSKFKKIFIPPAPNDAGTSAGAAQLLYYTYYSNNTPLDSKICHSPSDRGYEARGSCKCPGNPSAFLGPSYTGREIEKELIDLKMKFKKIKNPEKQAAEYIAKGKIIGWFQDRMEFGPRALGHRSILADPRDAKLKDTIDKRIKFRQYFRPYAPSILEEYVKNYFDDYCDSVFMSFALKVKPDKKSLIPGVTHVDGTSRLHVVKKETDKKYYMLIKYFKNITGIPMVLNTSFNIKEEPIVCTPGDALKMFQN